MMGGAMPQMQTGEEKCKVSGFIQILLENDKVHNSVKIRCTSIKLMYNTCCDDLHQMQCQKFA